MRYIGNKTRLLPFIASALDRLDLPQPTRALDAFAGTAAVGTFLKARGASVVACDLMTFSYVFQRAYVVATAYPQFVALRDDPGLRAARAHTDFAAHVDRRAAERSDAGTEPTRLSPRVSPRASHSSSRPLDEVLVYLDHYLDPLTAFISHHFAMRHSTEAPIRERPESTVTAIHSRRMRVTTSASARSSTPSSAPSRTRSRTRAEPLTTTTGEPTTRMYFTLDAARRIDAIRVQLHEWRATAAINDDEFYILLAALLEAADSVANTAGIYAAYIKSWQSNALRDLHLRPLSIAETPETADGHAMRCEAYQGDVSALAPTLGHFDLLYLDPPYNTRQYSAYYHIPELIARGWFDEPPVLRGKTGLLPGAQKSQWSTRAGCGVALDRLLAETDADHVVMSYNSEGIIPEAEITRLFRAHGRRGTYRRIMHTYQRYRSDRPSATRHYKSDTVREYLYCVRLKGSD